MLASTHPKVDEYHFWYFCTTMYFCTCVLHIILRFSNKTTSFSTEVLLLEKAFIKRLAGYFTINPGDQSVLSDPLLNDFSNGFLN